MCFFLRHIFHSRRSAGLCELHTDEVMGTVLASVEDLRGGWVACPSRILVLSSASAQGVMLWSDARELYKGVMQGSNWGLFLQPPQLMNSWMEGV